MVRLVTRRIAPAGAVKRNRFARWWKWLALVFLLLSLGVGIAVFMSSQRTHTTTAMKKAPVLTVTVVRAGISAIPQTVAVTGTVSPIDLLTITPEASGLKIVSVPVEEGQYVRKGQVLAQLDASVLQAQLQGARARLTGSQAGATKALQPNRPQEITGLQQALSQAQADIAQRRALLSQAEANAANAEEIFQRYSLLLKESAVSEVDARNYETQARAAREQVAAARANLNASQFAAQQARERLQLAQTGGRSEDIIIAQANAREIQATIAQLQTQIAQTSVRAPDDGLITKRDAHIGDVSSPSKSMFQMVRRGELELRALVSQKDLVQTAVGQSVAITDGIRSTEGSVWSILPTIDPATRLATVRVRIPAGSPFMPGMFARGTINVGPKDAITVPSTAVLAQGTENYVFIYENGIARRRPVIVATRTSNLVQIESGVAVNEQVIASGAGFLNDGDVVRVATQ